MVNYSVQVSLKIDTLQHQSIIVRISGKKRCEIENYFTNELTNRNEICCEYRPQKRRKKIEKSSRIKKEF